MKNKVVVTIAGQEYTMVAVEDEAYVRKCADYVDSQLRDIMSNKLPKETAAVLAAMNMADLYFKEQDAAENLRRQIKENLEEASRLKMELSEAKREIFKLQTRKEPPEADTTFAACPSRAFDFPGGIPCWNCSRRPALWRR